MTTVRWFFQKDSGGSGQSAQTQQPSAVATQGVPIKVPEPGTAFLLGFFFAIVLGVHWWQKRRNQG